MTDLRSALDKYLSMRKGLGYKYEHQTRRLADFVTFMEKRKAKTITTKLAMEWAWVLDKAQDCFAESTRVCTLRYDPRNPVADLLHKAADRGRYDREASM